MNGFFKLDPQVDRLVCNISLPREYYEQAQLLAEAEATQDMMYLQIPAGEPSTEWYDSPTEPSKPPLFLFRDEPNVDYPDEPGGLVSDHRNNEDERDSDEAPTVPSMMMTFAPAIQS